MSNNDYGSPRRLNWKAPVIEEVKKSVPTYEEIIEKANANGAPISRRGTFNGQKSRLTPGVPASLNPPIFLEEQHIDKALLQPLKTGPNGKQQLGRKRDQDGKFVEAGNTGEQSAGAEDAAKRERDNKHAFSRVMEKPGWDGKKTEKGFGGSSVPGQTPGAPGDMTQMPQDQNSTPMGQAPSGIPIYDDPFHPEHNAFTAQDHEAAASMHQQMAQMSDQEQATMHSQKANTHKQLAMDSQSPMERAVAGMQKSLNPFDWFFQQNHAGQSGMPGVGPNGQQPGMQGGMPGQNPDQNKPMMQSADNGMRQGPVPGMTNTATGTGMGIQTAQNGQAGTYPLPQEIPSDPYTTDLQNPQGQNMSPVPGLPPPSSNGTPPDQYGFMQQFGGGTQGGVANNMMPGMTPQANSGMDMAQNQPSGNPLMQPQDPMVMQSQGMGGQGMPSQMQAQPGMPAQPGQMEDVSSLFDPGMEQEPGAEGLDDGGEFSDTDGDMDEDDGFGVEDPEFSDTDGDSSGGEGSFGEDKDTSTSDSEPDKTEDSESGGEKKAFTKSLLRWLKNNA